MNKLLVASVKRANGVYQSKCAHDKVLYAERKKAINFLDPYVRELDEFFQEIATLGFSVNTPGELGTFKQVSYPDSFSALRDGPVDLTMLEEFLLPEEDGALINKWCPLCFTWVVFIGTSMQGIWSVALTKSKYEGVVIFFCNHKDDGCYGNLDHVYTVASLKNIIAAKIETFIAETGHAK